MCCATLDFGNLLVERQILEERTQGSPKRIQKDLALGVEGKEGCGCLLFPTQCFRAWHAPNPQRLYIHPCESLCLVPTRAPCRGEGNSAQWAHSM